MKRLLPVLLAAFLLTGCSSYYKIVDNDLNRSYYTKSITSRKSGAVTFTDAATGAKITLMEHAQMKITKDEYNAVVNPDSVKTK